MLDWILQRQTGHQLSTQEQRRRSWSFLSKEKHALHLCQTHFQWLVHFWSPYITVTSSSWPWFVHGHRSLYRKASIEQFTSLCNCSSSKRQLNPSQPLKTKIKSWFLCHTRERPSNLKHRSRVRTFLPTYVPEAETVTFTAKSNSSSSKTHSRTIVLLMLSDRKDTSCASEKQFVRSIIGDTLRPCYWVRS